MRWAEAATPRATTGNLTCTQCGAATNLYLCTNCIDTLEQHTANVPQLLHELDITITRQDNVQKPQTAHQRPNAADVTSPDPGIALAALAAKSPYNRAASKTRSRLRLAIHQAATAAGLTQPAGLDPDQWTRHAAAWLATHGETLATYPEACIHAGEIRRAHQAAMRAIDTTPDTVYLGDCTTCAGKVMGPADRSSVACPACGVGLDVEQLKIARDARATSYVGSTKSMIEMAALCGLRLSRHDVDNWKRRGDLRPWAVHGDRPDEYLFGDVLSLINRRNTKESQ